MQTCTSAHPVTGPEQSPAVGIPPTLVGVQEAVEAPHKRLGFPAVMTVTIADPEKSCPRTWDRRCHGFPDTGAFSYPD